MSIYTYESARLFCEFLNIEFHESPSVSDQELDKIPEDAVWINGMSTKGIPKSEEVKIKLSRERIGRSWYHHPTTLFEKQFHQHEIPEGWIKGRNPSIKHGGNIGVYGADRSSKISKATKGKIPWNLGKTYKCKPETSPRKKYKDYSMKRKTCPNCGLIGSGGSMMRFHFDNCKSIILK